MKNFSRKFDFIENFFIVLVLLVPSNVDFELRPSIPNYLPNSKISNAPFEISIAVYKIKLTRLKYQTTCSESSQRI